MSKTIAERPAEFIVQFDFDSIPDEAIQIAKSCVVDGIATILKVSTILSPSARTHNILTVDRSEYA